MEPWTPQEREEARRLFEKIERNNATWLLARRAGREPEGYPMPHDVYEAHRLTMKGISTEVLVFDEAGRILLSLRPSKEEDPAEPYASCWHIPGVRHVANETNEEAYARLMATEFAAPLTAEIVGYTEYPNAGHLGICLVKRADVVASEITQTEKMRFFAVPDLPERMIEEHRWLITQNAKLR